MRRTPFLERLWPFFRSATFYRENTRAAGGGSGEAASYFRVLPDHRFGLGVSTACKQTGGPECRFIFKFGSKRRSFSEVSRSMHRLRDESSRCSFPRPRSPKTLLTRLPCVVKSKCHAETHIPGSDTYVFQRTERLRASSRSIEIR
jgi:hypothetical protein